MPVLFGNTGDKRVFTLLQGAATNIRESATVFAEMIEHLPQAKEYATKIKVLEKEGDHFTEQLVALLNSLFITPLEREDILALVQELDDVIDGIEEAAAHMTIYNITEPNEHFRMFTQLLCQQSQEIAAAVDCLCAKNLMTIRQHNVRIKAFEKEGDHELRHCLAELFSGGGNPLEIIKMKEIYETLEATTDRAEELANTLEGVVLKNT